MNQLTEIKIRFSDAAYAIGVKPKVLRNWLQRNQITLFSDHTGPTWTQFTLGDIAVLAVMRRMVQWGVTVDEANEHALSLIQRKAGPLVHAAYTSKEAFITALGLFRMILAHDDDGELLVATTYFGPFGDGKYLPLTTTDFVYVNVSQVIEVAFLRLETD